MIYREFGDSGVKVSAVSFGAMRWPSEEAAFKIINRGLDLGVNYMDTSTGYVEGKSQGWSGKAVKDRRDEILFSSKSSFGKAPSADDVRKAIDASLADTGLEYFDIYQLWGLGKMEVVTEATAKGGTVEGVRKAMDEGLVKHGMGFTFHGPGEVFRAAIDTGEFICATVSYNLLKRAEEEQIAYASEKGVGMVIMNPMAGGVLALAGAEQLDFLRAGGSGPAAGALRFLLANTNITTSIIGFTAVEEVDQAAAALEGAEQLDEAFRQDLIEKMDAAKLIEGDFCTGCEYCKECPSKVNPAKYMGAMRDFVVYGVAEGDLRHWLLSKYPHQSLPDVLACCTECGECEEKCPQKLEIIEAIRQGKELLA
ncbi:hypothetical protein LCGC14_2490850 [marine sediment metagenome]|uniref:4Fe-4S ferredoxin-type domain-containing protein n=1 Tax=marine sediment metagenome TaxID=412755 RepID=A0A0F9B5G5_9ZZZZ